MKREICFLLVGPTGIICSICQIIIIIYITIYNIIANEPVFDGRQRLRDTKEKMPIPARPRVAKQAHIRSLRVLGVSDDGHTFKLPITGNVEIFAILKKQAKF